ncbi:MAG: GatB/YqeY domain-containing protein [Pseudomonadota bacterium]
MRDKLLAETKAAMKAGEKERLGTLRMISAAFKNRDIEARVTGPGASSGDAKADDAELLQTLQKMVKQRRESIATYEQAGRDELAAKEAAEISVIQEFLPKAMDDAEMDAAVAATISDVGADSVKDMGKVMGALKERYAGQMDFGKASGLVKARLAG